MCTFYFCWHRQSWAYSIQSASQLVVCCQVKLVKSWSSWWKVGDKLVTSWSSQVRENLIKTWSTVGQTWVKSVKFVKNGSIWSSWSHFVSGLSTVGDETVKWANCLGTHDTSSTPDTSVQSWGRHHSVFDHRRMVKYPKSLFLLNLVDFNFTRISWFTSEI